MNDCPEIEDPQCPTNGYVTYKMENGNYICEKECGSCIENTTLDTSDGQCYTNIGYYYDPLDDSENPPVAKKCPSGSYINVEEGNIRY